MEVPVILDAIPISHRFRTDCLSWPEKWSEPRDKGWKTGRDDRRIGATDTTFYSLDI